MADHWLFPTQQAATSSNLDSDGEIDSFLKSNDSIFNLCYPKEISKQSKMEASAETPFEFFAALEGLIQEIEEDYETVEKRPRILSPAKEIQDAEERDGQKYGNGEDGEGEENEDDSSVDSEEIGPFDPRPPVVRLLDCGFDHSSNSVIHPEKEYFLSRLPREIRHQVYKCILASQDPILVARHRFITWGFDEAFPLKPLQYTSSFLHGEITAFIKNTASIYDCPEFGVFDSKTAVFRMEYRNPMRRPVYFEMKPGKDGFTEWEILRFRCWQKAIELAECDHSWEIEENVEEAYALITGRDDAEESNKMFWETCKEFI